MTARGGAERMFPVRSVVLGAFVPSLVFEIGIGAMLPIVPLTATGLGASIAVAGFMASLLPIGQLLSDVPAGALSARVGDRGAMLLAGVVAALGFVGCALAPNLGLLGLSVLVIGAANAVFNLARHAYLTEITPPLRRARVLSTLAGVHRIGLFIGPFAGAAVIHGADLRAGYWLALGTSLVATAVIAAVRPERSDGAGAPPPRDAPPRRSMRSVLVEHRQVFATLGVAVLLVGAVRGARQTVLPLWGEHIGLDPAVTSLVFGIAGAADMLLFYPAGKVMDSFGRLWIGVPAMLTMGVAMVLLPLTTTVGAATWVAVLLGLGNGMSSGILMTLGADTAPPGERAQFLGIWRVFQDGGSALGPLVVSGGAALGSLAAGIWVMAGGSGLATAALARWVPRWSVHANRTTRRRAGLI